jgi:hypothetical protein
MEHSMTLYRRNEIVVAGWIATALGGDYSAQLILAHAAPEVRRLLGAIAFFYKIKQDPPSRHRLPVQRALAELIEHLPGLQTELGVSGGPSGMDQEMRGALAAVCNLQSVLGPPQKQGRNWEAWRAIAQALAGHTQEVVYQVSGRRAKYEVIAQVVDKCLRELGIRQQLTTIKAALTQRMFAKSWLK